MKRKLAAIFSTDVKGYSRLMGDDEEATIHTLKTYRKVISGLIERHHGRVVDSPGDNMLAEFPSAVDAVKSSVAIQQALKTRNAALEDHRKMEFRIGLNVGDVITDEGRLYGDGVNIAARLEGLAYPGGICISESIHTQVQNKLSFQYAYIGEREVKNIATPVPVYKVQLEADGAIAPAASTVSQERPAPRPVEDTGPLRRWPLTALAVVAVLLVAGGVLLLNPVSQQPTSPGDLDAPEETPGLPLPDKPSLAVLPFTNMSGDPEQEYFSDGMTEDIITDLSKISGLFVIARNSTFTYKGQAVDISDVSRKLGVRYVLEGSVRKAQSHVRINAQLIDATTGGHVWAERYDRELADIFALQDEITEHRL
jgi:adenylate cyclase